MTTKEMIEVLQAYENGKPIECKPSGKNMGRRHTLRGVKMKEFFLVILWALIGTAWTVLIVIHIIQGIEAYIQDDIIWLLHTAVAIWCVWFPIILAVEIKNNTTKWS